MATTIYGNGTTTASGGANTVVHFYDRAGIKAANAKNVYGQFVDKKSIPQRYGKTFKISKWQHIYDLAEDHADFAKKGYLGKRTLDSVTNNLANSGNSGVLVEGAGAVNKVTPKKVTVETSIERYGFMIEYTDEVKLFSEDDVQTKYREELGYLMNRAHEDLLQRDMLNSAGININAGGDITMEQMGTAIIADASRDSVYKVSWDLIRTGVKALVRNRAVRNTQIVTGSVKVGTQPINSAYYGIIGPEIKFDLETLTRGSSYEKEFVYVPVYQYASNNNIAEGEIGWMGDVRFIESEGAFIEAGKGAAVPTDYEGSLSYTSYANAADVIAARGTVYDTTTGLEETTDKGNAALEYFDVFPILFPTQGSFAAVTLKGQGKIKFHAKSPEDVELTGNPYGTKGFFSANMFYATIALQPEKLMRINVLASA